MPFSVLVDIDSTLYDADPVYARWMNELFGRERGWTARPADFASYNFFEQYGMTYPEFSEVISRLHAPEQIAANKLYPGALAVLLDWTRRGADIHIVSDRKAETVDATMRWLADRGVPYSTVALESRIDKIAYAARHGITTVIDDKPALLTAAADAGLVAASIRHPYLADLAGDRRLIIEDAWSALARRVEMAVAARAR
jgi:uncharacterized HAD superfamily protein